MPATAQQIANLLEWWQASYAATSTSLLLANDPDFIHLLGMKGFDQGTTVRLGRKDNSYYEGIDFWQAINFVRGNNQYNLEFMGTFITIVLSSVGHQLSENQYFDRSPELEFFRHLRNAVSHGNRFHFRNGEPRRPASFRSFSIVPSLQGQPFMFQYMSLGDIFDLFDFIKAHLRTLP